MTPTQPTAILAILVAGVIGVVSGEDEATLLASESVGEARAGLSLEGIAEFRQLDRDGSGSLDPREFRQSEIVPLHLPEDHPQYLETLFSRIDRDGSGSIGLFEFVQCQHRRNAEILPREAASDYRTIDRDLDGLLQLEEFSQIESPPYGSVGSQPSEAMFRKLDLNRSRVVGPFEFLHGREGEDPAHCLREEVAREFAELDRNDDGILNLEEYSENRELERKEIPNRFARIDFNGNGEISPPEFGKAKSPRHWHHGNLDEKIDNDFREMDRNRDNMLSHREFSRGFFSQSILKNRDRIDAEFARRDLDRDRELSLEEYSEGRLNYWESRKRNSRGPERAR